MRNPWHPLVFPAYFLATATAQRRLLDVEGIAIEDEETPSYRINKTTRVLDPAIANIIESSGERVWHGWDEEADLPVFGITHEGNRRAINKSTKRQQYFNN